MPITEKPRALVSWSSGKDSAFALHKAREEFDLVGVVTTVTTAYQRVAMHGVREEILERQAVLLGLPCIKVPIPSPCPNEVYEARMLEALGRARGDGVSHVIFGDLFLEDIRAYREKMLAPTGLKCVFPLWGLNTAKLAGEMIESGLRALLVCVDPRHLPPSFAGRWFDKQLLADLPSGVDPCGENGEFHTLVTAGPMFSGPLDVRPGVVVEREGFVFSDALA